MSVTPPVPIVEMHDEVYTFNTITKEWRKESSIFDKASDKLAERWGQTACLVDDKIYIFGKGNFSFYPILMRILTTNNRRPTS